MRKTCTDAGACGFPPGSLRVVAGQYYWVRYVVFYTDGHAPGTAVEPGLPYFDEHGEVVYWEFIGTNVVLDDEFVTVLQHIPQPKED